MSGGGEPRDGQLFLVVDGWGPRRRAAICDQARNGRCGGQIAKDDTSVAGIAYSKSATLVSRTFLRICLCLYIISIR